MLLACTTHRLWVMEAKGQPSCSAVGVMEQENMIELTLLLRVGFPRCPENRVGVKRGKWEKKKRKKGKKEKENKKKKKEKRGGGKKMEKIKRKKEKEKEERREKKKGKRKNF